MARRWKLGLLGAALSAGAAACAALAGLGNYQEGNPSVDAGVGEGAGGEDVSTDAGIDVPQLAPCGTGYVCFAEVAGWQGPFDLSDNPNQADAGPPPTCPDGGQLNDKGLLTDLVVPDASCPCTCTTQVTCAASFTVSNGGSCAGSCTSTSTPLTSSGCVNLSCSSTIVSAAALLEPSGCSPFDTQSQVGDASFATSAFSCSAVTVDSGACEAGTICSALPGAGFEQELCIRKEGENACPLGSPYVVRRVYYGGILDDRQCTGCSCDVIEEAGCDYTLTFHDAGNCFRGTMNGGGLQPGQCPSFTNAQAAQSVEVAFPASAGDAACTAGDASLSGEAGPDPSDAVTFCCTEPPQ